MESLAENGSTVDFYNLSFAWSMAVISLFVFGPENGTDLLHDLAGAHELQDAYTKERLAGLWLNSWPMAFQRILRWIGYSTEISCVADMRQHAESHAAEALRESSTAFDSMGNAMLDDAAGQTNQYLISVDRNNALRSEVQDHIVAGLDTSQITLTICVWLLGLEENRIWQARLHAETSKFRHHVQTSDVESLPILDAILKEAFRLYPVVAGCQPRMTDRTILLGSPDHQISVPPGVTVHSQAWSLHRNSAIFLKPDQWLPERWLDLLPERKREMEGWFWAFGSGSRRCLGEHLAISSLKVALVTIYSGFETLETQETKFKVHVGNMLLPIADERGQVLRLRVRKVEA